MIINIKSVSKTMYDQKGSALVNVLAIIVIIAILLMNKETVTDLAAAPVNDLKTLNQVREIVKAVNHYKLAHGGELPQSDAQVEEIMQKSIDDLNPAGAEYVLFFSSDEVTIKGISPTTKTYTATIKDNH